MLWPLLVYFAGALVLAGFMLGVAFVLGEHHKDRATGEPWESGIAPTGSARIRFDVRFYMIALFFVVFDLETAFLLAWAIAIREVGWLGYVEAVIFVFILLVALVYLWRVGALDWGPRGRLRGRDR